MPSDLEHLEHLSEAEGRFVRAGHPSDADAIERILSEASLSLLATSSSRSAVSNQALSNNQVHVCELGGEVVGVLQWRQVGQEAEIFDLAVDAKHRKRGFASLLLEYVISLAKERGAKEVFLEVRESNAAAFALYRKFGFTVTGRRPIYYHEPEEAALLLHRNVTG